MGTCLMGADGEGGVEKKHSLLGPSCKVTFFGRNGNTQVAVYLFDDVHQRRRYSDTVTHREAEPVSLTRFVVGVLSYDDSFDLIERGKIESIEYITTCGVALVLLTFGYKELFQLSKIGRLKLRTQHIKPGGFYFRIDCHNPLSVLPCFTEKDSNSSHLLW